MSNHKLLAGNSQLVVIDIQPKLYAAMPESSASSTLHNTTILIQAANALEIPVIVTEQYPQGLGETMPEIRAHLGQAPAIAKTVFSACDEPKFSQQLHRDRPQIILSGMEAHICVLQTALDLLAAGKQVFVVEDAVVSRKPTNQANALARLRQAGCIITNTESVIFEWLGNAKHPHFKALSMLIR